ncbi:MAG: hypothetical protein K0B37_15960, partial [Bacteroidales bacterium]|nr:hypothetical protein [Bacteroidales bacterium]
MKQIYPPRRMNPLHFPLKNLIVFLFFFLLLAAGVKGKVTSITCPPDPNLGPGNSQADIEI